ncbi:MAG: HAMP domain-containing histidine kinase, partial [Clostridiaceae bacterium]|nr:HAMP domain-containing histidine kinase [Clostridiaceae bacterium]
EAATNEHLEKILNITGGIEENASVFVNLFGRLDPLAAKKRETRSEFNLYQSINIVSHVFENELKLNSIDLSIIGDQSFILNGWRQDMYTIFTNLVDNSIFWMVHAESSIKKIVISIQNEGSSWYIDYKDSGPGIEPELLESGVIFEPEFTTKPKGMGTGLGLAIAGEAAQRNGLELIALQNTEGAHFKLYPL